VPLLPHRAARGSLWRPDATTLDPYVGAIAERASGDTLRVYRHANDGWYVAPIVSFYGPISDFAIERTNLLLLCVDPFVAGERASRPGSSRACSAANDTHLGAVLLHGGLREETRC
jgi:hypothetical protein